MSPASVSSSLGVLAALAVLAGLAPGADAFDLRLATENDVLTRNRTNDDLYTFSLAFEAERGPYLFSLRENAFTDREAGTRLDETYLTVERDVPGVRRFSVRAEAGIVHVGRGLFGQQAQNAVHRLIGDEEVDLRYYRSSLHPSLGLEAQRWFRSGRRLALGPRFEMHSAPGLRSHAVVGAQALWRASPEIVLRLLGGGRATHASLAPLEPHLATFAPVARIEVVLYDRVFVSWTHNDYGDGRQHVSLGYWTPLGEGRRATRGTATVEDR